MNLAERLEAASIQALRTSLFAHLHEANAQIAAREELYKLICQNEPRHREEVLTSVKGKLSDHLFRLLEEGLSESSLKAQIKTASRKLSDVSVEIPFQSYAKSSTSPWTARILFPIKASCIAEPEPSLEKDIYQTIKNSLPSQVTLIGETRTGTVDGYTTLEFDHSTIRGGLVSKLHAPAYDGSLKLTLWFTEVTDFPVLEAMAPKKDLPVQPLPVRTITLTEGAVKYRLIPIRRENNDFFPEYGIPFTLVTGQGELSLKRTSRRKDASSGGNYITGGLGPVYRSHQVVPGSRLVIRELEHHQRYFLDSVIHPPR